MSRTSWVEPSKIIDKGQVFDLIPDRATVSFTGVAGIGCPEHILRGIEEEFLATGIEKQLTLFGPMGVGNFKGKGLDHFAHPGLLRRVVGSYLNTVPKIQEMILRNQIEGYTLPYGVLSQIFRDIAARRPGLVTHVGLNTFVDPRHGGGKLNAITHEEYVERVHLCGQEWLLYKSVPIHVALLRGSVADTFGNMTMDREVATFEALPMAQAARNSGGKVIIQVEQIAERGSLNPRLVVVPGMLVDAIIVSPPEDHMQSFREYFNPAWSGQLRSARGKRTTRPPFDHRSVIARRAALELRAGAVVNLGVGMPEFVASIADQEEVIDRFTLTVEVGAIGGTPAFGMNFGASTNPDAIVPTPNQFDFYDGGGNDLTFVGFAQVDATASVNVSKLKDRIPGLGGFLNVTQGAKKVVFCGAFSTGDAQLEIHEGKLKVVQEGSTKKFVRSLEQMSFNSASSADKGQEVLLVTERAVFRLRAGNLELVEVAPGLDPEKDIFPMMEFRPAVSASLRTMDPLIFQDRSLGLANQF